MIDRKTDALINDLSADAAPVKRLATPLMRAFATLAGYCAERDVRLGAGA